MDPHLRLVEFVREEMKAFRLMPRFVDDLTNW
jgi:hypothetical protein